MNHNKPKVSVCIPTYNRTDFLRQSIESVLAQSFTDFELIISDNASQDSTVAIIHSFGDPRIVYQRHEKNIGLVNNWNSCLTAARGEYITIFHDDDLMLPDNLTLKVNALDLNENVGLVHSNFHIMDGNGSITKESAHFIGPQDFMEASPTFLRNSLLGFNRVNPPSAFIRKECFSKLGGFNSGLHFTPDFEYWMRISLHYDVLYLGKPLIAYRMHHSVGWTSSEYFTVIEGMEGRYTNVKGLSEEYSARRIILQQTKRILSDWKNTDRQARKHMIDSLNFFVEKSYIDRGKRGTALRSILQVCQTFPDLLLDASMAKLIVKALVGRRMMGTLKGLLGKRVEGA